MSGFVVDASVAIKWLVDEAGAELATSLLDHPLAAPDLLGPECANALWKKVMRAELSLAQAETMAAALERADLARYPTRRHLAGRGRCRIGARPPASDCIYLGLAEELAQPPVTSDVRLANRVRASSPPRFADLVILLSDLPQRLAAPGRGS